MENNLSYFKGDNLPVENVSWYDVQDFLTKLNRETGNNYRLPTEAEWEYAARSGGKNEKYTGVSGNDPDDYAWYGANSGGRTHPAGSKQPNGLGLYDMSGNEWECCSDWYGSDYYKGSPGDRKEGNAVYYAVGPGTAPSLIAGLRTVA